MENCERNNFLVGITKKRTMILLIGFLIVSIGSNCISSDTVSTSDLQQICQITIDIGDLEQFFHVKELPERKPLFIVKNDYMKHEISLSKFGERVRYISLDELKVHSKPYFEFSVIEIKGDVAFVEFRYPVEGIVGKVNFLKVGNRWKVRDHSIVER